MLSYLKLINFRNYREMEFSPQEGFLVVSGPNGSGKSNLLESIFYLGSGYSNRQVRDEILIRWGESFFSLKGTVVQGGLEYALEIVYSSEQRRKVFKINGKRSRPGSAVGILPVVIFSPQDLSLVQGGPVYRRRFLDLLVAQLRPQHSADLLQYRTALLQRNRLLRGSAFAPAELLPWDEQLAAIGTRIWKRRIAVLERLLFFCSDSFTSLSGGGVLTGRYLSRVAGGGCASTEDPEYRMNFLKALQRSREMDRRLKATTVGPHRDDFQLLFNGHEARFFSSQGEQRLMALALKMAHYRLLSAERRADPVLLLDDVFSELDERRRRLVFEQIRGGSQVIATMSGMPHGGYSGKEQLTESITLYRFEKRV